MTILISSEAIYSHIEAPSLIYIYIHTHIHSLTHSKMWEGLVKVGFYLPFSVAHFLHPFLRGYVFTFLISTQKVT